MISDKYLQSFAHFYRGEMNRLTCYRTRLDGSFHYAIILTSTLFVLYLQQPVVLSRYFPLTILFMNMFFCFIEARRYRYYLVSQNRVQQMEKGFLCLQILGTVQDDAWKQSIREMYENVDYTHTLGYCFCLRYFRNYIWLVDTIAILWFFLPPPNRYFFIGFELFCLLQHSGWCVFLSHQSPDI